MIVPPNKRFRLLRYLWKKSSTEVWPSTWITSLCQLYCMNIQSAILKLWKYEMMCQHERDIFCIRRLLQTAETSLVAYNLYESTQKENQRGKYDFKVFNKRLWRAPHTTFAIATMLVLRLLPKCFLQPMHSLHLKIWKNLEKAYHSISGIVKHKTLNRTLFQKKGVREIM